MSIFEKAVCPDCGKTVFAFKKSYLPVQEWDEESERRRTLCIYCGDKRVKEQEG